MSYIETTELDRMEQEIKDLKKQIKQLQNYNDVIYDRIYEIYKKIQETDKQDYGYTADDENEIFK
jgi:cell division protein FtsB